MVTHVRQEVDHALWPVDAQQHDLIAEQDLQGHKHQDLTGATDHLVPNPEDVWKKFGSDLQMFMNDKFQAQRCIFTSIVISK